MINEVSKYLAKHKKEMLLASVVVIGGIVGYKIYHKAQKRKADVDLASKQATIEIATTNPDGSPITTDSTTRGFWQGIKGDLLTLVAIT